MRRGVAVALALLLTSCAAVERLLPGAKREDPPGAVVLAPAPLPPAERRPEPAVPRSSAAQVADYLGRLRTLGPAALAAEATRQRQAAARAPSEMGRVKAAIALFLAQHPEEAEILGLVEPVARSDSEDPELRAMASFLQVMAADRRRLRESAAARVREERRAQDQLRSRVDAAHDRAEQLQQKLDALTALEKSLSDRQTSSR
jgi:hypothetical protein